MIYGDIVADEYPPITLIGHNCMAWLCKDYFVRLDSPPIAIIHPLPPLFHYTSKLLNFLFLFVPLVEKWVVISDFYPATTATAMTGFILAQNESGRFDFACPPAYWTQFSVCHV